MPDRPVPMRPIYEPEVAARAIAHLLEHPRRNFWVGVPSAMTILGERVAPKLPDGCLGRSGVKSQQSGRTTPGAGPICGAPGRVGRRRSPGCLQPTRPSTRSGAVGGATSNRRHRRPRRRGGSDGGAGVVGCAPQRPRTRLNQRPGAHRPVRAARSALGLVGLGDDVHHDGERAAVRALGELDEHPAAEWHAD